MKMKFVYVIFVYNNRGDDLITIDSVWWNEKKAKKRESDLYAELVNVYEDGFYVDCSRQWVNPKFVTNPSDYIYDEDEKDN